MYWAALRKWELTAGSSTWEIMFRTEPRLAMTLGAFLIGMWMMTLTSMLTLKASAVRRVMVLRLESSSWALERVSAQLRRICVVGTRSTLQILVLSGCLPGWSGSAQMPFFPFWTIFALTSSLVRSVPSAPT